MSERKKLNLPTEDELPSNKDLINKIEVRDYDLVYDRKGVQRNRSGPRGDLTWYVFDIIDRSGRKVGEYHIHPDSRDRCGYSSGNLRLFYKEEVAGVRGLPGTDREREIKIMWARKWQWLCEWVAQDVDKYHGFGQYHRA